MDHIAEGAQLPAFSLDAYMLSIGKKAGSVGAYASLLEIAQQKIPNSPRYQEYPKCVKYGSFAGVAEDATHDAALKAQYDIEEPEEQADVDDKPVAARGRRKV